MCSGSIVILLETGCKLHTQPAQPAVFSVPPRRRNFGCLGLVNDLLAGKLAPEDWVQKCFQLRSAQETLGVVKAQTIPAAPSA